MKTAIFNRPWRATYQAASGPGASGAALTAALLLLATVSLTAGVQNGVVVGSVSGGGASPFYGSREGNPITSTDAQFYTPSGLAQDSTGEYLFVADRDNNKIRVVDLFSSPDYYYFTYTFAPINGLTPSGAISKPVGVALDAEDNVYVLNRGNGNNGTVLKFDPNGNLLTNLNTSALANANAIALDPANNVYVSAGNALIQITAARVQTTIASISGATLQGLVVMDSGLIAACDSGLNGIYLINPTNHVISNLTGFNGKGDNTNIWETTPNHPVAKTSAMFNQPMGLAKAGNGMLIVADYGNNRVKVVDFVGTVTNLYAVSSNLWYKGSGAWPGWHDGNVVVPDALGDVEARLPNGVLFAANDTIYVTEDYYHLIRQVTGMNVPPPAPLPPTLTVSTNGGQISLTWSSSPGATSYNVKRYTSINGPFATIANTPSTSYTDTSVIDGTIYYYVVSALGVGGEGANSFPPASAMLPLPPPPTILTVLTNYGQVYLAWSTVVGANITYNLKRSTSSGGPYTTITGTASTSYTDTSVLNGTTYYYVVSTLSGPSESANSAPVSATPPLPPVPDPKIGYVDFPATSLPIAYTAVFHPVSSFVLNNDVPIVIEGTAGSQTFYTYEPTSGNIPDPTTNSASAPVGYQDGFPASQVAYYTIAQILPDLTLKAIGAKADGSPNSAIVQARFQFVTANPIITGNNAAQFTVSDLTTNAQMWYTVDGSNPTNALPSVGPIPSGTTLSLQFPPGQSNLTVKVMAFRDSYQPSGVVPIVFSATNFVANTISFGFASGEASSEFIGAPGQTFYAPVTLSPLSGTTIYSLQYNLTVTNGGGNPGPAVAPGAYFFESMLEKPDLSNPGYYLTIPPAMFLTTNQPTEPPPGSQVFRYNNGWFEPLTFADISQNLLGVGWLERRGKTNLYDTKSQTLISFSQAHDTMFTSDKGKVILGGYAFLIPPTAIPGQTYQIQIGRPSATSDGVGTPGSDVYIATPTNGSLTVGAINSIKVVTAGQRKYVAGDCAPFGWFNAGDFGNTNLDNSDVEQVFQSAIYSLNYPPPGSDFFDSMDSCGGFGGLDPNTGYLTNAGPLTLAQQNAMFDANDTLINSIAFGNQPQAALDVCDVYVTFRRSLDSSLTWYRRFWTNGVLEAEPVSQSSLQPADAPLQPKLTVAFMTNPPSVNFAAADFTASAGQTLQIPVTAKIFGSYPLRVLMLNLSVEPLDGSPALTSPVQFTPNAALGSPDISSSTGNANYAATWLKTAISGLTGSATLGTLTVTIPANAPSSAAYAIHFDHASASPNGLASFPKQTLTGLILLSDRSSSSYGDAIPDSWRLRYFGTVNNILSQASADADGDGASNWQEYVAGTDPTDPNAFLHVSTDQTVAQQSQDCVVHWPSIAGKRYIIERSTSLFGGNWIPVSTNTGTGTDMEFHDTSAGGVRFYRVHVTP